MNAIFEISDEHKTLAAFAISDGEELDVLAMAYRKPDGQCEAKVRQRYPSGKKDVWTLNIMPDEVEADVVDKMASLYEDMRADLPNAKGRFVCPTEAARFSTVELLTFAMQGCQLE